MKMNSCTKSYLFQTATEELVKELPKAGASLLATIDKSKGEPEDMMKTFLQVPGWQVLE